MALVSGGGGGGGSRLNPNAPLYIPAAVRKVEDFTPEWYDLISTSTWYRDYWLSQHQEANMLYNNKADNLDNNDIVDMLPDDIDFAGIEEDMAYMDSQFHEFARSYGHHQQPNNNILPNENGVSKNMGLSKVSFPPGSKFAAQPINVAGGQSQLRMQF